MFKNKSDLLFWLALPVLFLAGCSVAENVNLGSKAPETKTEPKEQPKAPEVKLPVFIYSYTSKGKPVESGRIVSVNEDGSVTIEILSVGEPVYARLDPRGWLLVKPPSPIVVEEKKAEVVTPTP